MRLGSVNGEESKVAMLFLVDDGSIGGSRHCYLDTRHQDNAVEQMACGSTPRQGILVRAAIGRLELHDGWPATHARMQPYHRQPYSCPPPTDSRQMGKRALER